jgi:RimJ/RimL family protein N-acetyltransferase
VTIEVDTPRLRLRQWRDADREPFAALNADPAVMEFFPSVESRESSDASIDAWQSQLASRGWSNWALELRATGELLGFTGLSVPRRALPFSPCVEVTTVGNVRSRAVMERIGLRDTNQDFDYPAFAEGHPLRRHCLYRITREEWHYAAGRHEP